MALFEPSGERLGPDAVTAADVVLLPGLAVDGRGMRLGRGGGSYDRVLARLERVGAHPALVVLLYDSEVVDHVPTEAHDRPVRAAVTPSGLHRFPRTEMALHACVEGHFSSFNDSRLEHQGVARAVVDRLGRVRPGQ